MHHWSVGYIERCIINATVTVRLNELLAELPLPTVWLINQDRVIAAKSRVQDDSQGCHSMGSRQNIVGGSLSTCNNHCDAVERSAI